MAHNVDPGTAGPCYFGAVAMNPDLDSVFATLGAGGISITLKKR